MAKSLAFWLEGNTSVDTSIELHFNYWLLNMGSKQEIDYLDVGVKFKSLESLNSINIFFPFEIKTNNYIDNLGLTLSNNRELIAAIFNARIDNLKTVSSNVFDICFVNNKKDKLRLFTQIELSDKDANNGVSISNQDGGSILSFPTTLIQLSEQESSTAGEVETAFGYFRFRIKLSSEDKKSISQIYVSKDAKFLSRIESTEIVDFRVNEVRNLPNKIVSKLNNNSCITSVHFFLIRETNSEHKLSHSEFKRCRLLEKNLWDSYLSVPPNISIPEQMLIYHWKEPLQKQNDKQYLENFSAFAKFCTITVTRWRLAGFICLGVILGMISGVFGNFVYSFFQPSNDANTNNPEHIRENIVSPPEHNSLKKKEIIDK
ncbi:MAG: hypothetical protein QX191_00915 [Methylococcaceae bacterium]